MDILVSVIIPIHNTEKYLPQCLDSIITQTYKNLQIILINDGSTDGSGDICETYAEKDSRIQVIHQKNEGVSAARNMGLSLATGKYIFFLDADDICLKNTIHSLLHNIQDHDLAIGSIQPIEEDGRPTHSMPPFPEQVVSAEQMLTLLFHEEVLGYQGFLSNKLYRHDIICNNNVRFRDDICYNEDRLFLTEYLLGCNTAKTTNQIIYLYRQHEESALGQQRCLFHEAMLSELDAYEVMKALLWKPYPSLYYRICFLSFEKSLYWLRRIPVKNISARQRVARILRLNCHMCIKNPDFRILYKIKLLGHYVLRR